MMNKLKARFIIISSIILSFIPLIMSGQQDSLAATVPNDTLSREKAISRHSLYSSLGFGNNMIYMGSSISQDKPYYYGGLTYGFKNELFASVSTSHFSAYDPVFAYYAFTLNYSHTFNSWFDISLDAARYQFNSNLPDTLFTSFFYGSLTMGFDWKILYTKLSAGGIFAESSGFYLQLRNSRYFQTSEFSKKNAYFTFDPYVNLLFGTLTKTTDGTTVSRPFGRKSTSGSSSETSTIFSLMEIDLGIPVAFNIGRFTIETEPGYIIPLYSGTEAFSSGNFIILLGCYIKIF